MPESKKKAALTDLSIDAVLFHSAAYNATQIKILDGAKRSIQAHGVRKTSLMDIANFANVTRPTVYSYFANKEEIIRRALLYSAYELARKILERISELPTPEDKILTAVQYAIENLSSEPYLALISENGVSEIVNDQALTDKEGLALLHVLNREIFSGTKISDKDQLEITEVSSRFVLSMLLIKGGTERKGDVLRRFLEKRFLPSLALYTPEQFSDLNGG